jgi:transcriptional regulator with XRE-family HTH domain
MEAPIPSHPNELQARRVIGQRLRSLRQERALSQLEAAERAGLSRSFISMVESGSAEIALSRLIRLADVYGVLITELLVDIHDPQVELTTRREQYCFPAGAPGVDLRYLASPSWPMQPFRIVLQPGAHLDSLSHAGEEFIHCQQGQAVLKVSGRDYALGPGDTIYIPSGADHAYLNPGKRVTHLIGSTLRPSRVLPVASGNNSLEAGENQPPTRTAPSGGGRSR